MRPSNTALAFAAAAAVLWPLVAGQECPAAPWRQLPLATSPASLSQLDLANWQTYIRSSLIPHLVGALVALVIAIVLLLSFIAWRLIKCCTCCACVRGPRRTGKKARTVLAGRGVRFLKSAVLGAALVVLIASVYSITQVDSGLVDAGLDAIVTVTSFIDAALGAGQDSVASCQAMDTQLLGIKAELQGLALPAGTVDPYVQAIDDAHAALSSFTSFSSDLSSIRANTVDKITSMTDQHTPLARTADKWRAVALYIAYSVLAGLSVLVAVGTLVDWPAAVKPLLLLLLILMVIAWLLVVALTAVLRVGNDVCVNAEAKVQELAAGSISLGSGDASSLITYYLTGTGGTVKQVLSNVLGLDVDASLAQANTTLQDLQAAIVANPALATPLGPDLDALGLLFVDFAASVDTLLTAVSYAAFHPVWTAVKGFICCTVLNSIGTSWTGLIACGSCGLMLILCVFSWIGRMDTLRALGCCQIYSQRDYTLEGEGGHGEGSGGDAAAQLKIKKGKGKADPMEHPQSPTIMARKEGPSAGTPGFGGNIKASRGNRVAPSPSSVGVGPSAGSGLYPEVHTGDVVLPPATGAVPAAASGALDDAELRQEAERAAQLAGQAYAMASQAQSLLDIVARSNSRMSASGARTARPAAGAGGGTVPSSPLAPAVGLGSPAASNYGSAYSGSPGSPASPARGAVGSYGSFKAPEYLYSPPQQR